MECVNNRMHPSSVTPSVKLLQFQILSFVQVIILAKIYTFITHVSIQLWNNYMSMLCGELFIY